MGRPMLTVGPSRRIDVQVESVVSSEGPYRFQTCSTLGALAKISSTRLCGKASPARFTVVTLGGIARCRANSAIADGTVLMSVTSAADASAGSCSAFSAIITVPQQASGTNNSKTDRSKQIEVAASTPRNCSRVNVSSDQFKNVAVLACAMATPFGTPVDPEV